MFKIDNRDPKVIVSLDNGVYQFYPQSGTGKTWLYKTLRTYATFGEPVMAYSYADLALGIELNQLAHPGKQKVLLLDRFDLYKDKYKDVITEFAETGIVLIDCKGDITNFDLDMCDIEIRPSEIEVSE